ncbi:MAG: hypothetical protein WD768_04330 [Phycisphaeraceae bacterium]
MWRWLFTFAAIVSHALLVLTLASWVRSSRILDEVSLNPGTGVQFALISDSGTFFLDWCAWIDEDDEPANVSTRKVPLVTLDATPSPPGSQTQWEWYESHREVDWSPIWYQFGGFGYFKFPHRDMSSRSGGDVMGSSLVIALPHWFVALVASILPCLWILHRRRHNRRFRRAAAGLCPRCGYDPRGPATKCPECGSALVTMRIPQSPG